MSSLYFLGIRKSTIKKIPPFKYLFDWRDRRNYQKALQIISGKNKVEDISEKEGIVNYWVNGHELKLYFRKFPCSDLSVLSQVFESGCYYPIIEKMLAYYKGTSSLKIIDAGANVGYSCLYFKSYFPQSNIIAIEPEKSNIEQLRKNFIANNHILTELVEGGLWNRNSFLEVVRDFRDNREAAFTVIETTDQSAISGYSFNDILGKHGWSEADLVKIDIEGGERFLFDTQEHADNILQRAKFLAIEIHDEFKIRDTIYDHLKRNNFSFFEFDDLTLALNRNKLEKLV